MGFYKKQAEVENLGLNPTVAHTQGDIHSAKARKNEPVVETAKVEENVINEEVLVKNALKKLEDETVKEEKVLGEYVENNGAVLTDSKVTKKQRKIQQD